MTTVSATPQQMRDRLLQAIDSQSNICNMVVVLEVITCLEKYPITKEALEETRLGKLINDVRKKTKDEDLAKRAKKLLRNWQKLIEPGPAVALTAPGSTNGSSHPCRTEASPPEISLSVKGVPEVKVRNDVHNTYSPKAEKSSSRKRRAEHRDSGVHLPEKISKFSSYDNAVSPPPTNGIAGSPDTLPEQDVVPSPDRSRIEHLDNDKINRIPVNAVKPRPSSPGVAKLPSTSSLIKVAVMQQQARMDDGGGGGGHYQARSPRGLSTSPRSTKHDSSAKRSATHAQMLTSVPSPSLRDSPLPLPQPATPPAQSAHSSHRSTMHWATSSDIPSPCPPQDLSMTLDSPSVSPAPPPRPQHNSELHRPTSEATTTVWDDTDAPPISASEYKRRKYRSRDYSVNLDGQRLEDTTKPVRLKERRLTFDPATGQIKPLIHKEPSQSEEPPTPEPIEPQQRTEVNALQATAPGPNPNPFHQTNWKELSRNEIIQSYLNLQSNVLTSSGVQAPSTHFFMSQYLKREEQEVKESRQMHVLRTDSTAADLPGVSREVNDEDLDRIHNLRWPGVNGCLDTKDTWYDWTECISLDPHGDESKLNILPYVCLD
ncbi:mediator of RNA polymerase II transcription subunit 26 [Corythoichthys intestinalis]|uniref:mediator of RNA polymerase II transcription subunit 26 n=1 Tax=Corythoichthys intestinalis TaxID=161448 RepID=UPI0025A64CEB|nr:mediator of RNA polymerase II transcription subunit 26 [Corythoichthys intestinalis]XP_057714027.1 mediator of RNA polymerase II transcription subunit 26 [Corythoichthys intestinalis]XP_061795880.1 mediator of RNA polymerase II transcription subunit 26-like [Nerophis lumbriciformis]